MKSISRSANLKQKASPEGLAKCLISLVGAVGFELTTPCTPCNHKISAQRFDFPQESQAQRLKFYALGIAIEAACLLGCCWNISRSTRPKYGV
ncbi:MAG: hypothetical protein ABTR92_19680 [Candidatus Accumulibacter phosphatis]